MDEAEAVWEANKGESHLTSAGADRLQERAVAAVPTAPHRVLYAKGGQYLAAARIDDPRASSTQALLGDGSSVEEAQYLTAILNSPELTKLVAPMQARGEHNPRDFDKQVWRLPIPLFDPEMTRHRQLVELAAKAEEIAAGSTSAAIAPSRPSVVSSARSSSVTASRRPSTRSCSIS